MSLLLDTHVIVWWLQGTGPLTPIQRERMGRAESRGDRFSLSAMSLWEIAKLAERGRLRLRAAVDELLVDLEAHPRVLIWPLTARIALESTRLGPGFPRDPADQIIAATARVHGLELVTADERIRATNVVSIV